MFLAWLSRYRISYHYTLWKMQHTVEPDEIEGYGRKIEALCGKTGESIFVHTYNDTTKKNAVRRAAAMALIKSDPALAETVFGRLINSTNPDVAGMAITDLGKIRSTKFRHEILQKRSSTNEIVRWAVAGYLGNFKDAESIGILKNLSEADSSQMVREYAASGYSEAAKTGVVKSTPSTEKDPDFY